MNTPDLALPNASDPCQFRAALGNFCTGITVITAHDTERPLGLTCQSFSSLSLDPPLVLLSPARSSTTWPRIRALGAFCINVLAEDQQELSSQMAQSGTDKFAGIHWHRSPLGSPVFPGAATWLDCTLRDEHDGGDHTIVVAAVHDLSTSADARPLLYHRSHYATLASGPPVGH